MDKIEQFNWWLTSIPDKINELKGSLDSKLAGKLDGSLSSLDILEEYLLATYAPRSLSTPENSAILDHLASYVGDIAEKNIKGSVWTINTTDKKDVDYNFPVLKIDGNFFNPFSTITASLHRKKGDYIRKSVEAWM